ncbi:MAG: RNA methyltransferase [Acidobacteriota bacterium]
MEGPHLARELLSTSLSVRRILVSPQWKDSEEGRHLLPALRTRLEDSKAPQRRILEVEAKILASLMDADSPKGVLIEANLPRGDLATLPLQELGIYFLLDGVQDPGNVGAIARVAESVGAAAIALAPGCADPNHSRALRASAGSLLRIPVAPRTPPQAVARHLAPLAPRWVALATRGGRPLWECPLDDALVLLVGAEGRGLSPEAQALATVQLTIPLASPVESLNAAVAAAVVAFEAARQRQAQ